MSANNAAAAAAAAAAACDEASIVTQTLLHMAYTSTKASDFAHICARNGARNVHMATLQQVLDETQIACMRVEYEENRGGGGGGGAHDFMHRLYIDIEVDILDSVLRRHDAKSAMRYLQNASAMHTADIDADDDVGGAPPQPTTPNR